MEQRLRPGSLIAVKAVAFLAVPFAGLALARGLQIALEAFALWLDYDATFADGASWGIAYVLTCGALASIIMMLLTWNGVLRRTDPDKASDE